MDIFEKHLCPEPGKRTLRLQISLWPAQSQSSFSHLELPVPSAAPTTPPRDSPGGWQDEAKGAVQHSTNHKVGGGIIRVCREEALVGVAWAWGHRSWASPRAGAACCASGSWLPWGGKAEHLLGQEEAVLRVPHPVLHAPAAPHGERDVAGHS